MQSVKNVFDVLNRFNCKSEGTYSFLTGETMEYEAGYQVSFVRPEAFDQLNHQDWDDITNHYCTYLDSIAHIGVYGGTPEISFHCSPIEKALEVMEEYNQESIFNWEKKKQTPDNEDNWYIANQKFDEKRVLDYGQILNKIRRDNERV